jgi:hypothetical protein
MQVMMKLNLKISFFFAALSFATGFINSLAKEQHEINIGGSTALVNPSHLDHLYEEIEIGGKTMAIVHIYSDYPDYKWVEAKGEGIACIDDVTRAAIFYSNYY